MNAARARRAGRTGLAGSLVVLGLAQLARADQDPLFGLETRQDEARRALVQANPARVTSGTVLRRAFAALLEDQASELTRYAGTAPAASAALALEHASARRLEALALVLSPRWAARSGDAARVASLRATLARGGAALEQRAFACVLEAARSRGRLVETLDARARSPEAAPAVREKLSPGPVRILVVTDGPPGTPAALADGVPVVTCAGARSLGVTTGRVELVLDREGRVRGADLRGDERRALLQELTK